MHVVILYSHNRHFNPSVTRVVIEMSRHVELAELSEVTQVESFGFYFTHVLGASS